jgi:hypothetical protein
MRNKKLEQGGRRKRAVLTCAFAGFGLCAWSVWAADASKKAPPPKFDAAQVGEVFFKDARLELKGEPPKPGDKPGAVAGTPGAPAGTPAAGENGADGNPWSTLITSDTLEAEIKAQPPEIDKALKAANPHKETRMVVTYLATLYNVIFKFDKDVRWKADGHALRDSFAKGGNNMKAWTDSQKKQAVKLKEDLQALIQGNPPSLSTSLDGEAPWVEVADRTPLMHRFELGLQGNLAGWSKDADTVKKNKDAVVREAEVMAMLARVIQDKSYDSADDAAYLGFAKDLEKHAVAAAAAAKSGDGATASSAVAKMQKACDDCHGSFR